jgi:zinc transport system substrate-binding protein
VCKSYPLGPWALLAGLALFYAGCSRETQRFAEPSDSEWTGRPVVYVVNYPLAYFARRIGGDQIEVVFPAPPDVDPAFWQPDEQAISGYQNADLILLNGASFAKWTEHTSLPRQRVVNTSRSFANQYIEIEDGIVHQHGPEGEHAHEGFAFTTWLDPQLALQQAEAISTAFAERWPEHADDFRDGWESLRDDWLALDAQLTTVNAAYQHQPLLASHPVYQYLARRCGWNLASVHWEPDEMPDDQEWQELRQILTEHPARWMIWEDEPLPEIRERLAEMGIGCAVFDPCGNVPESGDLLTVMRENVERLQPVMAIEPQEAEADGAP